MNLVPSAAAPDLISPAVAANPAPTSIPVKSLNLVFSAVAPSLIDVTVSVNFVDIDSPTADIVPAGSFANAAIPPATFPTPSVNEVQPSEKNVPILSIPAEIDSCDTSPNVNPDAAPAIPSLTAAPNLPDFLYSSIPADIPSKIPIAAVTASPMPGMNLAAPAAPRSNPFPATFATLPAPLATLPAPLAAPLATVPAPLATAPAPLATLPATAFAPSFSAASFPANNAGKPINANLRDPSLSKNPPFSLSSPSPNPPSTSCCNNEVCFSCSPNCASASLLSSAASSDAEAPLIPTSGADTILPTLSERLFS